MNENYIEGIKEKTIPILRDKKVQKQIERIRRNEWVKIIEGE